MEYLAAHRTGTTTQPVLILQVSVESLDKGCTLRTNMTFPRLVVLVVSVHMVHQASETTAIFIAEFTDAEGLDTFGDFLLGGVTHPSGSLFLVCPTDWPAFPLDLYWRRRRGRRSYEGLLRTVGTNPSCQVNCLPWS